MVGYKRTVGWDRQCDKVWSAWVTSSLVTNATGGYRYTSSSTATTTTTVTWTNWNRHQEEALVYAMQWVAERDRAWNGWTQQYVETEQQRVERQRNLEQFQREQRATAERIRLETAEAKEKAEKLLISALDNQQREELKTRGFFHCKSKIGHVYRIYRGSHGNVKKIVNNVEVEKLCVQPSYVPEGDCMLAQKLHIENDEENFRRTANITRLN